jgi:hypothetical protein
MELTAVLTPADESGYIALNPETGTTTQGETVEEGQWRTSAKPPRCTWPNSRWCRMAARW